jgi:hypothetical protein
MISPARPSNGHPAGPCGSRRRRHARNALSALAAGTFLVLAAAACSSGSSPGAAPGTSAGASPSAVSSLSAGMSLLGSHSLPAQTTRTLPAFPAYYDAHQDVVVVTDAFPRPAAAAFHANFAPSLSVVKPSSQPLWYIVRGSAAAGQLAVLGSEPGESDYSPLWRTAIVRWKAGVTPKLLTSDNMINNLAHKGSLTVTDTSMIVNAAVVSRP